MRPRIRTIKPETWADEKVGDLSHGARLLFIGLITMADDQGRLRDLPPAILGHVFPHDGVSNRKLAGWLDEIASLGMVVRYEVGGKGYIAFPHWNEHQRVDRPSDSVLPEPVFVDSSSNGSTNARRATPDVLDDHSRSPRTRASGPFRSGPVVDASLGSKPRREPSKRVDLDAPPSSLPPGLHDTALEAHRVLGSVQAERGGDSPTVRGVGLALARFPDRDHLSVVRELEHWALAGTGQAKPVKDWCRTFATFLKQSPAGKPSVVRNGQPASRRENASDWLREMDAAAAAGGAA